MSLQAISNSSRPSGPPPRTFPKCDRRVCVPGGVRRSAEVGGSGSSQMTDAAASSMSFEDATWAALTNRSHTPNQQFVAGLVTALRENCPKSKRGTLRSILEGAMRVPDYAEVAAGAAIDLVELPSDSLRGALHAAAEICARARPDSSWPELLSSAITSNSLDDLPSALAAIALLELPDAK